MVAIQVRHHPPKHHAMRRRILQPPISNGVVDHLMQQDMLILSLRLIIIVGEPNRIIVALRSEEMNAPLARHGAKPSPRLRHGKPRKRKRAIEVIIVKPRKPVRHPFQSYLHQLISSSPFSILPHLERPPATTASGSLRLRERTLSAPDPSFQITTPPMSLPFVP